MLLRRGLITLLVALGSAVPAEAAPRWTRIASPGDVPAARLDHAMASTSSTTVWMHGGRSVGNDRGDLWRYAVRTKRWTRIEPDGAVPPARFGHNLIAEPGGTLLMFGGQSDADFFNDRWRFDPKTNRWTKLGDGGPEARYGAAGAIDPATGRLVVSHGFTNSGRFDDTWLVGAGAPADLSPAAGKRPSKRCLIHGAASGGRFFLFGGQSNADPYLGDLWVFDLAAREWNQLGGPAPSQRNTYAATVAGGRWWIHGGAGPTRLLGDLWRLDMKTGRFRAVKVSGRNPAARSGHAAAPVSGGLLIFGGATNRSETAETWRLRTS